MAPVLVIGQVKELTCQGLLILAADENLISPSLIQNKFFDSHLRRQLW